MEGREVNLDAGAGEATVAVWRKAASDCGDTFTKRTPWARKERRCPMVASRSCW